MFSSTFVYFIFVNWIQLTFAYTNDSSWVIVSNEYTPIGSNFNLVTFRKHPRSYGKQLNSTYPALYLRQGILIFGQTENGPNSNGSYCAVFNVDSNRIRTCTEFRILKNTEANTHEYYLIKPEMFDPLLDDPVGFDDKFLVIAYDHYTDSSFFGTLHRPINGQEPEITAIDYDNAPIELKGRTATSNDDFVLYVVKQRPFFQTPFHGLCKPIDLQDSTVNNSQTLDIIQPLNVDIGQPLNVDDKNIENDETLTKENEMNADFKHEKQDEKNWFLV